MAKSRVAMSPGSISEKWNRRMKQSVGDIQRGIDSVQDNPMEAAAAKQDKMLQNLTAAVTGGRWAASLRGVNFTDWKNRTKQKVGERLAGGVDASMGKRQAFDTYLVNTLNGVLPQISEMPDMTLEDSVNRVRTLMEHMASNPFKGRV